MKRLLLLSILSDLVLSAPLVSQDIGGTIEGWVADSTRRPVEHANIVVQSSSLLGARGTTTDSRGFFRVTSLPPGTYVLRISHVVYESVRIEQVQVALGRTTAVGRSVLVPQTLETGEITVSGERPLLDPSSSTTGANLRPEDVKLLPIERNYRSMASFVPHVNSSPFGDEANIAGATGTENRYYINGTDVTDPFRGTTGMNLPYYFIKEVEVKVGGYEAEYRSSLGGIINVTTPSGSNEFHGTLFGGYTDNNFAGPPQVAADAPPQGSYGRYDLGFGIGGPLVIDRLWFFAAYSPFIEKQDVQISTLGFYPDKSVTHSFAAKLNWRASEAVHIGATMMGDPTVREGAGVGFFSSYLFPAMTNPDPALKDVRTGGYTGILDAQWFAGRELLLEVTASWTTRREKYWPSTVVGLSEPLFVDYSQMLFSGGSGELVDIKTTSLDFSVRATVDLGPHTLKGGLGYEGRTMDNLIVFSTVDRFSDTFYRTQEQKQSGLVYNRVPWVFIQDSWAISERFRLNAGVRWDGLYIVGSDGGVLQKILSQYQPRVGFVFLPGDGELQRIFGSFGRYAEDLQMYASTVYFLKGAYQVGVGYAHDPRLDRSNPDTLWTIGGVQPEIDGLRGQYFDEFTLGYERRFGDALKGTVRGVYRALREILEDGVDPPEMGIFHFGNPGHYPVPSFPRPKREYIALELTLEKPVGRSLYLALSYILSRNWGNYVGLFDHDYAGATTKLPNAGQTWDQIESLKDATGSLPNDRTHVLKFVGTYQFDFGLTCGTYFFWGTGTPLNDMGTGATGWPIFLQPRGTAGRMESVWDLNVRFTYLLRWLTGETVQPRFIVDIFHVGSPRTPLVLDQRHYWGQDENGNQTTPNPYYLMPQSFQPPMSVRLGVEVSF